MEISRRLIGPCATFDGLDKSVKGADIDGLIRRLILFDTYIMQSSAFKELPYLLDGFGYDGLLALLQSDALKIHCHPAYIGQIGNGRLPFLHYQFAVGKHSDWQKFIDDRLQVVDSLDALKAHERDKLKHVIQSSLLVPPNNFGDDTLDQMQLDLQNNISTIKLAIAQALRDGFGIDTSPGNFIARIHQVGGNEFQVETDIPKRFNLDQSLTHQAVERALLAIGRLDQRIEEMRAYSAISGFLPGDVPLFGEKLGFLAESLSPHVRENEFQRVLDLTEIPTFESNHDSVKVDAQRLLEIRNSAECREFRGWLSEASSFSDTEIKKRLSSLRVKLAVNAHTTTSKTLRFLFITGIGSGIGLISPIAAVVSVALGVLDTFLLDKVLPVSGPATFINDLYASIFRKEQD